MTIRPSNDAWPDPASCRLCGGPVLLQFSHLVLRKYPVNYWRCENCHSLQTDPPHWLDESHEAVQPETDVGLVARNWQMAQISSLILRLAGVSSDIGCLDWGGGSGLFCRMMRDQGYSFVSDDKYAEPIFCRGFTRRDNNRGNFDVITSFEVFEHLADPRTQLAEIIAMNPCVWIFSTQIYTGQDSSWNYFGPNNGRHVFFYSQLGLTQFGAAHGFEFLRGRDLHIFLRRTKNPYFGKHSSRYLAQKILAGGKLETLAAGLHFLNRQRRAYLHWRADGEWLRQPAKSATPPTLL